MTIVHQPRRAKQASVKIPPPAPPERLGPGHYKVWSRTQPGVSYETRIDPATGERVSCTCLAGQNDHHCWHIEAALRAARADESGACEAVDASREKTPPAPSQREISPFNERGEYLGPLAEAFDRPMRATRGGRR